MNDTKCTYYSVISTVSRGLSYAAASNKSLGCLNAFIILISSRTCSRSFTLIVLTNLAAKFVPVDRSMTLLTTPYRPFPNSSRTSYLSPKNLPSSGITKGASRFGSNSS